MLKAALDDIEHARPFTPNAETIAAMEAARRGDELVLPPALATPFVMTLHELATNAAKYGALGEKGRVSVTWRIVLSRNGRLLELVWRESGGPPVPSKRSSGFGTYIIENGMSDAKVERRFEPDGLVCQIEVAL